MVGEYQPPKSRYKCMYIFMRPPAKIQDERGNWVLGPSPGKTNCILPIGHKGTHMNVRGECSDGSFKKLDPEGVKY